MAHTDPFTGRIFCHGHRCCLRIKKPSQTQSIANTSIYIDDSPSRFSHFSRDEGYIRQKGLAKCCSTSVVVCDRLEWL